MREIKGNIRKMNIATLTSKQHKTFGTGAD